MEENLDVSTLFIVKCVAHIKKKKCSGIFCLLALKTYLCSQVSDRILARKHTKPLFAFFFFGRSLRKFAKFCEIQVDVAQARRVIAVFFFSFFFFGELECERPEGADVEKMTFTSMSRDRRQRCTLNAYCFFALKTFPLPARSCPDPAPTETFVQTPVTKSSCLSSRVWESGIVKTEQIPRVPKQTRCLFCWLYRHADVISFYSL